MGKHPFAPESDDPATRCGDCNMLEGHPSHDGAPIDYRYWPGDLRPEGWRKELALWQDNDDEMPGPGHDAQTRA